MVQTTLSSPHAKCHIRKATLGDIPFMKQCLMDSWLKHARENPDLMTEKRVKESKVEEEYSNRINKNKDYMFIAEVKGIKAGLIVAYKKKLADFFKDSQILYIDDIYVVPKFRRNGIAKILLAQVEKITKKNNIKRIDGRIYEYNIPMQKLLTTIGFKTPYSTWVKIVK